MSRLLTGQDTPKAIAPAATPSAKPGFLAKKRNNADDMDHFVGKELDWRC
jgi:hypothetical protein